MAEITDPQEVQAKQQAIADRRAAKRQQITQEVTQQYSGFAVDDRSKKLRASIARRQSLIENLSEQIETAELYLSVMQTMLHEITSPISVGDSAYFRHKLVQVTGVTVKHSGDVIYRYRCVLKNGRSSDVEKRAPWYDAKEMRTVEAEHALQIKRQERYEDSQRKKNLKKPEEK